MHKKQHIIVIGPAYPYRGGNSLFVSHLYDLLKEQFAVTLLNYKLLYPDVLFPGKTQYDESKETIKQAPSIRAVNSINPFNWLSVASRINALKPDLVIFDWWHPFFGPCHFAISSLLTKHLKARILFITENVVSHEANLPDRMLTRLGLWHAKRFLALSDIVVQELKKHFPGREVYQSELPVYDCYQSGGTGDTRAAFGYTPNDRVLLFFGYVRKYKGLDVLLRAMPLLLKKNPAYKLLIVGEYYESQKEFDELAARLGITDNVQVVARFVANEEVEQFYRACDVVVLPYRGATQSGIISIAYGFEKPVVVTNVGGLAESVDDGATGIVTEPESPEALAEGIQRFYQLREQTPFTENIRAKVRQNGFYAIPGILEGIINRLK